MHELELGDPKVDGEALVPVRRSTCALPLARAIVVFPELGGPFKRMTRPGTASVAIGPAGGVDDPTDMRGSVSPTLSA